MDVIELTRSPVSRRVSRASLAEQRCFFADGFHRDPRFSKENYAADHQTSDREETGTDTDDGRHTIDPRRRRGIRGRSDEGDECRGGEPAQRAIEVSERPEQQERPLLGKSDLPKSEIGEGVAQCLGALEVGGERAGTIDRSSEPIAGAQYQNRRGVVSTAGATISVSTPKGLVGSAIETRGNGTGAI